MKIRTKIILTIILTICLISVAVAVAYLIGRPASLFISGISGFCIGTLIANIWER